MIKNILNTIFVRVFNAVITLLIVVVNSNAIGAEGIGIVSLIVLAVSIFMLITEFVTGALIYFVPRENNFHLFLISWIWVVFSFFLFFFFTKFVPLVPEKYIFHVLILALIFAGSNIHEKILTGNEKIITVNFIALIRIVFLLIPLLIFYFLLSQKSVVSYIYALFISYAAGFFLSAFYVSKYIKPGNLKNVISLFKRLIKLSTFNAFGNIVQKLNYRLSYYFIEYFSGIKVLGQFSVAVQISESVLIISRSVAFVHYSKISNLKNNLSGIKITQTLIKFLFLVSVVIVFVFSIIPSEIYSFIFGKEFFDIKPVVQILGFGIVFLSLTMIFSAYFAGKGKHYYNMSSSFVGFIFTIIFSILLIPKFSLKGAGTATSFSYAASFLFQFYLMKKTEGLKLKDIMLKKDDFRILKEIIFSMLKFHGYNKENTEKN